MLAVLLISAQTKRKFLNRIWLLFILFTAMNCFSQSPDNKHPAALDRAFEIANKGNKDFMFSIAQMYLKGDAFLNVEKDTTEAIKWLEKAAKSSHITAMNNLAALLIRKGNSEDSASAFSWYLSAAGLGNTYAMLNLGMHYITGKLVQKDVAEGLKWITKSAENNNYKAMSTLGEMYANGKAVNKDSAKAAYWYKKATDGKLKLTESEKE